MRGEFTLGLMFVNGINIHYEILGPEDATPPLVLLHGGDPTIETSFGPILPELAKQRRVIGFDQAGHGRTEDRPDQPFSFEQTADDAAALLEQLGIDHADFYGYSNGGTIALQIAIRYPKIVRKIIVQSASFSRDGMYPWFWDSMQNAKITDMPKQYQDIYQRLSPHPDQLQSYFEKSVKRMIDFKDIPVDSLKRIEAPALIMVGDHDVVKPEHAVEMYRLIPNAQLAILPNTDHMKMVERSAWELPLIESFLG